MTNTLTAAELLVQALEDESVERIFGLPGEENLDLIDAIRRSRIELILTCHEQGGRRSWPPATAASPDSRASV